MALPTSSPEAIIEIHAEFGFRPVDVDAWRRGDQPTFGVALGVFKIDFRPRC